jgi:hypothetical protein
MPLLPPLAAVVERVRAWPVESQLQARRNAMVASTALASRRAEREDVEAFLAGRTEHEPVLGLELRTRR